MYLEPLGATVDLHSVSSATDHVKGHARRLVGGVDIECCPGKESGPPGGVI
ncbi:hypothetical protein DPMN_150551 [Dreissena polymorpha]|uniref:Uncharacterized protein n=1 Tax=Dreissena polymorpha TaxID=45954 RepID=A0A9D4FDZ0_DREPO|nr:hypothetical protein DPMN_150551 [Dreissena polymorpha]